MFDTANILILADSDGGEFIQILVFVVVAVFWAIGALVKKAKEAADRNREQQQLRDNIAGRSESADADLFTDDSSSEDDGWTIVKPPAQQAPTAVPPVQAPPRPTRADSFLQAEPVDDSAELARQQKLQAQAARAERVLQSTPQPKPLTQKRTLQTRRAKLRGLSSAEPSHPTTASSQSHEAKLRVRLDEPKMARAAIIFHEILSTPKALRDQPEIWDR